MIYSKQTKEQIEINLSLTRAALPERNLVSLSKASLDIFEARPGVSKVPYRVFEI